MDSVVRRKNRMKKPSIFSFFSRTKMFPNKLAEIMFSSVHFSHSVLSDSLRPHESQQARPPCPSPTPGVHSNSCPSSRWYHPAISSSDVPFSSCPQSLPASGSFPMSQLFTWGGQSIGVSASPHPQLDIVFALAPYLHSFWSYISIYLSIVSFYLSILFMVFSTQEYRSGLPFPSPVDHILQISPPWPAHLQWPHTAWLSFIELDKAVVQPTAWKKS